MATKGARAYSGRMHSTTPPPLKPLTRRKVLGLALAASALATPPLLQAQSPKVRLRLLLNTGISSPQAWPHH